jgi:presqualene diphosphate synthase
MSEALVANAAAAALPPQDYVKEVVARSGTSFFWSMRLLPRAKREAMFAIYAFCREVDDIADGDAPLATKHAQLQAWRDEIDRLYAGSPAHPITRALAEPMHRFALERADFIAIIDGMLMDAEGPIVAPSMARLELYCARVAGAVGKLSVCIYGVAGEAGGRLATALGEAVQLTNVLRDLKEDADIGRLYLPSELLAASGISERNPQSVLRHPHLPAVCEALANRAEQQFVTASTILARLPRRNLRPARVIMQVYRLLLQRLKASGFSDPSRRVSLSGREKILVALRYGLL